MSHEKIITIEEGRRRVGARRLRYKIHNRINQTLTEGVDTFLFYYSSGKDQYETLGDSSKKPIDLSRIDYLRAAFAALQEKGVDIHHPEPTQTVSDINPTTETVFPSLTNRNLEILMRGYYDGRGRLTKEEYYARNKAQIQAVKPSNIIYMMPPNARGRLRR